MSDPTPLPTVYDPKQWEDTLYAEWEASGFFNPDTCIKAGITDETKPTFSIVLPPPNVTGVLHAGHASMLAIEDTIVRYHRMRGDRTLWLPGTDHAAIATQSKVEKLLIEQEGKNRHDLGRTAFLERVERFAQDSHDTIVNQCKKMGSSLDWSREAYTLDDARTHAVRTAFKRMYDDGLIYRGDRIVNWDPVMQTTVSDDEIEWHEETIPFYYLQYGPFVIATARPETKFGDKYVVVHPDDERYADYKHGQTLELEWINGPITATVIKDDAIDLAFGTGAMTITPWHDMTDFDIAERHHLDKEPVIDEYGKLLPIAGEFAGLPITEARTRIIEKLQSKGLVVNIEENYIHNIAKNSRGGATLEPQIKRQWFVSVNTTFDRNGKHVTLKSLMKTAVRSGAVRILPERFSGTYFHWINHLRDWCISRQIWFGHRIPVWYRGDEMYCDVEAPAGDGWEQDPDTLDTWFSSGLWTFSTLGWPNTEATDFKTYHPTQLLETGYDILFFWVARMILMSEYLLGVSPFETVYLHGLVRDEKGRKMSKSLGNTIDPLDVSKEYGADALRLALMSGTTPGNDAKLSHEKIVAMRNFTNKLWNLARYIGTATTPTDNPSFEIRSDADRDLIHRLRTLTQSTTHHLDQYELSLAIEELRAFTWDYFADWYIEVHKVEKNDALLRSAFTDVLKLWHPFMPFITEAIHKTFHFSNDEFLMIAPWPHYKTLSSQEPSSNVFPTIQHLIIAIRNARATYHIEPVRTMELSVNTTSETMIRNNEAVFMRLARISTIHSVAQDIPKNTVALSAGPVQIFLHLDGVIDTKAEHARLSKELTEKTKYINSLKTRLADPHFSSRAPEHILAQTRTLLAEAETAATNIEAALTQLEHPAS